MTEFPSITVLLPVFMRSKSMDQVRLLREALTSVADQSYPGKLEVLLVDDGSPFPVQEFASDLGAAESLVRWMRLDRNQGIVGALNAGLSASRSDLIARLDADDRWLDGKLAAQVAQFLEDGDLSISATGMVRVDTSGKEIDRHIRPGDWAGILRFFIEGGCPFPHGSVVADRRVYRVLGGYPWSGAVRHCEDYALWGTWLRFFKPAMVEKAYYSYRVSDTSVSAEFARQQAEASQRVRRRFEKVELTTVLPKMLPSLAEALGCSMFEAGVLAYRLWHFRTSATVPEAAIGPLVAVLPDRALTRVANAPTWRTVTGGPNVETPGMQQVSLRADSLGETA